MKVLLAVMLVVAVAVSAVSAQAPAPVNLAFATLDTGSAWYVYGATMAELLRKTLPPGSNIDVKPRAGGVGNPRLVAKNETPLGLAFTVTNRWAFEGKEAYTEKLENIRALVGGFDTYYLVAMATKKLGITSVREIRDKKLPVRVYTQPVGALGEFAGRQLLRAAGIMFAVVTPKHPSVSEIVSSVDVEFLGLDADTAKALLPLGYVAATMPPDTFKGQSKPVSTVGFPTVLITNKDLPEPIAYTVTKTVLENKDALVRGHAGLAEFEPRTAWQPDKVGIPLHPGAERAYREKGWMK